MTRFLFREFCACPAPNPGVAQVKHAADCPSGHAIATRYCPFCGALPGMPCVSDGGAFIMPGTHDARREKPAPALGYRDAEGTPPPPVEPAKPKRGRPAQEPPLSLFAVRIVRPHPRSRPPENPFLAGYWLGPPDEEGSFTGYEIVSQLTRARLVTSVEEANDIRRLVDGCDADFEVVEFREIRRR